MEKHAQTFFQDILIANSRIPLNAVINSILGVNFVYFRSIRIICLYTVLSVKLILFYYDRKQARLVK